MASVNVTELIAAAPWRAKPRQPKTIAMPPPEFEPLAECVQVDSQHEELLSLPPGLEPPPGLPRAAYPAELQEIRASQSCEQGEVTKHSRQASTASDPTGSCRSCSDTMSCASDGAEERVPARTPLKTTAKPFVPAVLRSGASKTGSSPLPFVPSAVVAAAWDRWYVEYDAQGLNEEVESHF